MAILGIVTCGLAAPLYLGVRDNTILTHVEGSQRANAKTLDAIAMVSRQTHALEAEIKTDEAELAQGNTTVGQILQEAGAAVMQLEKDQASICAAVHVTCSASP